MITKLSVSYLSSKQRIQTARRITEIVEAKFGSDAFFMLIINLVKEYISKAEQTLSNSRSSEFTELLSDEDNIRDIAFVIFRDFVEVQSKRRDSAIADAAKMILDIIKQYGWKLHSLSYTEESAAIEAMNKQLEVVETVQAIDLIGATPCYSEFKDASTIFESTYKNKVTSEAREDYPKITETNNKLGHYLAVLLDIIDVTEELEESGNTLEGIENISETVNSLNEIILDVMTIARSRQTRSANDQLSINDDQ